VSAKQSGWLQNLWTDAGTCVHCTITCPRYYPLWPATWSSASLTHGQAYHKTSSTKQLVDGNSGYVQAWRQMTSVWTSTTLKPALFRANTLHNGFFTEPPTVYRGNHVVSHHLHCSNLKANKVSKGEGTRKVNYAYYFWKCFDVVDWKLSKLVHACRSYNLPKLARFFWDTVYNPVTLKSKLRVTQGHWKRNHWIDHTRLTINRVIWRWIISWPWNLVRGHWLQCARGTVRLSRFCFVPCSFNNSWACPSPTPPSSLEYRLQST